MSYRILKDRNCVANIATHEEFLATRRFSVLDGLRGIAILLVFTAHPRYPDFWPYFYGSAGVTIFFVLSGFLITTLLLREESKFGKIDLSGFFIRRLFRLCPMYLSIFSVYCLLILVLGLEASRRSGFELNIPYFLFLFPEHSMFFNSSGTAVPFDGAWSMGIEEKFYLVWPIIGFVFLAGFRRARPYVLCALALGLGAISFLPIWGQLFAPYTHLVLGALVSVMLHSKRGYGLLSQAGRGPVLVTIVITALALRFGSHQGPLYIVYGIVIAALVAGIVTTRTSGVNFLTSRFLIYTGTLSYVLYLIHNFGLNAAEMIIPETWGLIGSLISTVLGIGVSYIAAALIHRYFEEPCRQIGVRIAKRRRVQRVNDISQR